MRIWVTGIGVVSPLGHDADTTMAALVAGRTGFGPVSLFDATGCRSAIAAELNGLVVSDVAPAAARETWSRTDAMSVLAAREAMRSVPSDVAVDLILGGTTAGMFETEDLLAQMHADPSLRQPRDAMLSHPLSATVDRMRQVVRPFARARTICSACSSGANALLLGASWLRTGRSERVLAGGADGLCRLTYTGFSCLGALSPEPCRPFDQSRKGLTLGEGAAFLLLETESAARARGADPIVELRGWAVAAEAHHITNPQASGETAARVMTTALRRAELAPSDIDYINAHGTATKLNDPMEATAIRTAFGAHADHVVVSSTKSMIGHTLGAAGAIEAAICALTIARGVVPPTVGLIDVDPACALNHLHEAQTQPVRATLSNSFGFGGSDATIVLAAPGAFEAPRPPVRRAVVVTGGATLGPEGVHTQRDASSHLAPGPTPSAGAIAFEASDHLDLGRARRIDRAGRFAAATMKAALSSSGVPTSDDGYLRGGAIVGVAYGTVDACSAFMHRVYEKGAKFASPAVFPNLLPSSPVAHASIYHRLKGPVFSSADLDATSVGAMVTSVELISADEADLMLAGGVEEMSHITEAVLGPLHAMTGGDATQRSEGTVVLVLEARDTAVARNANVVADVIWSTSWRGPSDTALRDIPPAEARSVVVAANDDDPTRTALSGSVWAPIERRTTAHRVGSHECASGFAAVAGLALLQKGEADAVLVLGVAPDRGYAFIMRRYAERPATSERPAGHEG